MIWAARFVAWLKRRLEYEHITGLRAEFIRETLKELLP